MADDEAPDWLQDEAAEPIASSASTKEDGKENNESATMPVNVEPPPSWLAEEDSYAVSAPDDIEQAPTRDPNWMSAGMNPQVATATPGKSWLPGRARSSQRQSASQAEWGSRDRSLLENREEERPSAPRPSSWSSAPSAPRPPSWADVCETVFCSFRTGLAPTLVVLAALALGAFAARLMFGCDAQLAFLEAAALLDAAFACLCLYGVVKGKGWLFLGWSFSIAFAILAAVAAACGWINYACLEANADVAGIPAWCVPTADTLRIGLWVCVCYLYKLGYRERDDQGAGSEKRTALLS